MSLHLIADILGCITIVILLWDVTRLHDRVTSLEQWRAVLKELRRNP